MKRVSLRAVVGCWTVLALVASGRAATMTGPPVIMQYVGADFTASGNPTGAFKIVNLGQSSISSAQIDLTPIKDAGGNPTQAFEAASGGTNLFSVNATGSHGIDASGLDGLPIFPSLPIGSSTNLFPVLTLNFKPNTFGPGDTFAFDIPVVKVDTAGNIVDNQQTGVALAGGLVSVNTTTETNTGTLFVPPPTATGDHNASVALLTPNGLHNGGGEVPEPASLVLWSLLGLGGYGLRRKSRAGA